MSLLSAPRRSGSRTAFTLIELLVVIAIIAILAAILFPVFAKAREKARQTVCLSNEKQVGTGLMMYLQDYDEKMPSNGLGGVGWTDHGYSTKTNGNWIVGVQPYIKNWAVFVCPSSTDNAGVISPISNGNNSTNIFQNGVVLGRALAAFTAPSTLIWEHEYAYRSDVSYCRPTSSDFSTEATPYNGNYVSWVEAPGGANFKYDNVHNGGGNLLFCDGHAKWQNQLSISARQFGLNSDLVGPQPSSTTAVVDAAQVGG